jgi:hypothetical protein
MARLLLNMAAIELLSLSKHKKVNPDKKNFKGGKPKKLTTVDERAIISQINITKVANAIEVVKNLNNIINNLVLTQTI